MSRWLLLGALAVAIWLSLEVLVSRVRSRLRGEPGLPVFRILGRLLFGSGSRTAGARPARTEVRLVRCSVCGQHVPEDRARRAVGGGSAPEPWYCSSDCQRSAGATAR